MKIGLCVVGCGEFAKIFANSIQPLLTDIDLYFASRDLAKAKKYSLSFNGRGAFGSYEDAAEDSNIHAMYICTPHYLHLENAILAASNTKHVLIEKPIACSTDQAKQLIKSARQANVNLMIAENYRFMPGIRLCKQLVTEGAIGQIRVAQIQEESQYHRTGWRNNPDKNGGGSFIDAGIHKVHFLRYLMGEPSHIYALPIGNSLRDGLAEDGLLFVAKWRTDEVGVIYHSSSPINNQSYHRITLTGTCGSLTFNVGESQLQLSDMHTSQILEVPGDPDGLLPMTKEFISSIRDGREPELPGEEGLRDLELVEKAYQSVIESTSLSLDMD